MSSASPWPSRVPVQTTSRGGVVAALSSSAVSASACSSVGASPTTTTLVPSGAWARMPASARARSSGQSVASSTTVAEPVDGASSREGTDVADPYLVRPPSSTSGAAIGVSAKSVPRSTTFQPAASISARSSSARAQSWSARACDRTCAADRTSSGMRWRVIGAG